MYLEALLRSNRNKAQQIIMELLEDDVPIEDIYLYIFQETMRKIGVLWQEGVIPVGREHYATAITQYMMSLLYPKIFNSEPKKHKLVAYLVGSELHEMGIPVVAEVV